ncbi:MAG TPA: diguanylate cyclase [Gemmataceae bacterium]
MRLHFLATRTFAPDGKVFHFAPARPFLPWYTYMGPLLLPPKTRPEARFIARPALPRGARPVLNVTRFKCSVLVVDDDPGVLALLMAQLAAEFEVVTASTAEQARTVLAQRTIDLILCDLHLPDESGLKLLDSMRRTTPRTARVLLSGTARLEDAVDAINHAQVHRLVLKPWRVEDLLQSLRAIGSAILLERSHEQLLDELRNLNADLEQRVARRTHELEDALAQVKAQTRILEQMALTDTLTNVPNRRAVESVARNELLRRIRIPSSIALGMIDVDFFKDINTAHKLSGGDHVLSWLARALGETVRSSDSFGRWGGEEFMVVAPSTDAEGAAVLGERLRAHVEASQTVYNNQSIGITVSIGFAVAEAGVSAAYDQLFKEAAAALKEAKDGGRNRCVIRCLNAVPIG